MRRGWGAQARRKRIRIERPWRTGGLDAGRAPRRITSHASTAMPSTAKPPHNHGVVDDALPSRARVGALPRRASPQPQPAAGGDRGGRLALASANRCCAAANSLSFSAIIACWSWRNFQFRDAPLSSPISAALAAMSSSLLAQLLLEHAALAAGAGAGSFRGFAGAGGWDDLQACFVAPGDCATGFGDAAGHRWRGAAWRVGAGVGADAIGTGASAMPPGGRLGRGIDLARLGDRATGLPPLAASVRAPPSPLRQARPPSSPLPGTRNTAPALQPVDVAAEEGIGIGPQQGQHGLVEAGAPWQVQLADDAGQGFAALDRSVLRRRRRWCRTASGRPAAGWRGPALGPARLLTAGRSDLAARQPASARDAGAGRRWAPRPAARPSIAAAAVRRHWRWRCIDQAGVFADQAALPPIDLRSGTPSTDWSTGFAWSRGSPGGRGRRCRG